VPGSITMLCHVNNLRPEFVHSTVPINVRYEISGPSTITVRGQLFCLLPVRTARLGGTECGNWLLECGGE
jgi:hypothetical protein